MKPVVLVGFMGCGKSTVGRALSGQLGRPFIDTDSLLVDRYGPISAQFSAVGEDVFRMRERAILQEVFLVSGAVVAVGGGAFVGEEASRVFEGVLAVFLQVSFEVARGRVAGAGGRPLFNEGALALYTERQRWYRRAQHVVDADAPVDEVVRSILEVL